MRILRYAFLITAALLYPLHASTGGKLSGTIQNEAGEALAGANIILEGTDYGTASGEDGSYFILNIPPGFYTVRYMMMGYQTEVREELQIKSDLTAAVDISMRAKVLESDEAVVVTAERPLIQKDATSRIQVISAEEISNLPVQDFREVLAAQAGFTTDADNEIHVRGGRSDEIRYMIDGIIVENVTGSAYEGLVNTNSISEMSIISGTFNAEYGQAMSSIVNIVTKDGGDKFHAKAEYGTDRLQESPYHSSGAFAEVDDAGFEYVDLGTELRDLVDSAPDGYYPASMLPLFSMPGKGRMSVDLSGKVPYSKTYYYFSSSFSEYDSYLPHGTDIRSDTGLKFTRSIGKSMKLRLNLQSSSRLYQNYVHDWKYLPLNNTHNYSVTDRITVQNSHSLSPSTYYTASYAYTDSRDKVSTQLKYPEDLVKPEKVEAFSFYSTGDAGTYSENSSRKHAFKFDLTSQVNQVHLVRTGLTYEYNDLDLMTMREPWPSGTNFSDDSTFNPVEASFYIQDKIEFDFLIINIGLRYDRLDPRASMWEDVTRFVIIDSSGAVLPAPIEEAPVNSQWSPRLGLAYPVTDRTVFHFSFGHFLQNPGFSSLYYNSSRDISSALPLVGNPKIRSQKTVSFETGLKQELSPNSVLEFSAWMKDIRDLLSTQQIRYLSSQYILYTNTDYASVKGFDLSYRHTGRNHTASIQYGYSLAKGNNSSPMDGYFNAYEQEEVPHEEYYLSFDRRHDIALALNMKIPAPGSGIGKLLFRDLYLNILHNSASGLPYTPYTEIGTRTEPNSARMPWTHNTDLRMKKEFPVRSAKAAVYLDLRNVFDVNNILYVYSRTGDPYDDGFTGVGSSADGDHDPSHVGPGREIRFGSYIEW